MIEETAVAAEFRRIENAIRPRRTAEGDRQENRAGAAVFTDKSRKDRAWSLERVGRDPSRRGGAVELEAPPIGPAAMRSDQAVGPGARCAPAGSDSPNPPA
jgi:hypothetical protein